LKKKLENWLNGFENGKTQLFLFPRKVEYPVKHWSNDAGNLDLPSQEFFLIFFNLQMQL